MFLLTEQISKDDLKKYLIELYDYSITVLDKINVTPEVILKNDEQNAEDMFGKTGYYDPEINKICLYITNRHPKDVLRSFAHELVHHEQNCRGDTGRLDMSKTANDPAYASHDPGLREMEREAFERGNMIFRDWCDKKKMEKQNLQGKNIMSEKFDKKKADLNRDGKISPYEKKRGKAIQKSMEISKKKNNLKKEEVEEQSDFESTEKLEENHPHPELFTEKERLFKDRMNQHEELIYQELMKKFISEKK